MHDPKPTRADRRLTLAPDLTVRFAGPSLVTLRAAECSLDASARVLPLLPMFASPTTLREALARADVISPADWAEASGLLAELERTGFLVDASDPRAAAPLPAGFDGPAPHVRMLNDRLRTEGLLAAIAQVVRRGDVVLDLGTGTGVLALAAARAGASRVYAIEEGAMAEGARRLFEDAGVGDRVRLVRGRSTRVTLPERATVLVSEILGSDPVDEDVVASFRDAHARHLAAGARTIPSGVSVLALPVDLPEGYLDLRTFTPRNTARWSAVYGVSFARLAELAGPNEIGRVMPQDAADWATLGEPVVLADLALDRPIEASELSATRSFIATRSAESPGLLLAFRATLAPGVTLSTLPSETDRDGHWTCAVVRGAIGSCAAGDRLHVAFSARNGATTLALHR